LDCGAQGIDARGLEPKLAPTAQLAAARLLEFRKQVAEFGVSELVLLEVVRDAEHELGQADPGNELLENRAALGIGDAVEVDLYVFEVVDCRNHWVGRGQLV